GGGEPGPDAGSLDGGDDRLGAVDDVVDEVARLLPDPRARRPVPRHGFDHAEVAAGGEDAAVAAQQRHRGLRVAVDVAPDLGQLAMPVGVERVKFAGLEEDDLQDARARARELEGLVVRIAFCHGYLVTRTRRSGPPLLSRRLATGSPRRRPAPSPI